MPILALLVLLPMIEIGLFVTLGAWIGRADELVAELGELAVVCV